MKQYQYVSSRTGLIAGPYSEDEVRRFRDDVQTALSLTPGQTWTDCEGDVWSVVVSDVDPETDAQARQAERLERIATAALPVVIAATLATPDVARAAEKAAAARSTTVYALVASDAVAYAHALIAKLDEAQ